MAHEPRIVTAIIGLLSAMSYFIPMPTHEYSCIDYLCAIDRGCECIGVAFLHYIFPAWGVLLLAFAIGWSLRDALTAVLDKGEG